MRTTIRLTVIGMVLAATTAALAQVGPRIDVRDQRRANRDAARATAPANVELLPAANGAVRANVVNYPVRNDQWRYRYYRGRWWYWLPSQRWVIWTGYAWVPYYPNSYATYYSNPYPTYNYSRPYYYGDGYRYDRPYRGYRYYDGRYNRRYYRW